MGDNLFLPDWLGKKKRKKKTKVSLVQTKIQSFMEYSLGGVLAFGILMKSIFFLGISFSILVIYSLYFFAFNKSKTEEKIMVIGAFLGFIGFGSFLTRGIINRTFLNGFEVGYLYSIVFSIIISAIYGRRRKKKHG